MLVFCGLWNSIGFAEMLDGLPGVMRDCGVASRIIQNRREEIARLAGELRALREMD